MHIQSLISEFLFDCRVRELSPRTIANYEKQVNYFSRFLLESYGISELEALKPLHIKGFIRKYQEAGRKPSYINDLLKAVKCMCAYAFREGYSPALLTEKVSNVREPRVLIHTFSEKEIKALIYYYRGTDFLSLRNRVIIMLLFDTGIRISELLHLRLNQIQDASLLIHGKGRKERLVPKGALVAKWLQKYLDARKRQFICAKAQDYVFLSKNGKPLTAEAVTKFLKAAAQRTGVNPMIRVSPHTFRHTFAHQQLKNGIDLYSLSRLLGHESVSITQRYLESIEDSQVVQKARETGVLANL